MTEKEICEKLYAITKGGAQARRDGSACPHAANTLAHFLHSQGWLTEDLRLALMKHKQTYCLDQLRFEPALGDLPELAGAVEVLRTTTH